MENARFGWWRERVKERKRERERAVGCGEGLTALNASLSCLLRESRVSPRASAIACERPPAMAEKARAAAALAVRIGGERGRARREVREKKEERRKRKTQEKRENGKKRAIA